MSYPGKKRRARDADEVMTPVAALAPPGIEDEALSADPESREWVELLRAGDPDAVSRLAALLLRAARFELSRRSAAAARLGAVDRADLAQQAADDALMAILAKLDTYRGASRFTTWAYKFALLEMGVKLRRRVWQEREIPFGEEGWHQLVDVRSSPPHQAETAELLAAIRDAIERELTPHQRRVLVAIALNEVPIDVLAERGDTTRGALYKTLHDARRKQRASLEGSGGIR